MRDPRPFVAVALVLVVVLMARRWIRSPEAAKSGPGFRWLLAAGAAVLTMALTTWIWGGLRAPAVVDDEAAYVLQADLFAHAHWKLPGPVPAASFTQPAVLVTPVLAPKMAPGHALLLAPGVAVGLPGLIPILLSGATAALFVLLVCEVQSTGVAVLALVLWLTAAGQMRWRASYFSEITTGMLWLLGWWALLRWRQTRHAGWLLVLAAATGWGAITRPLTMLAFALPVGIVVVHDVIRGKHWRQLGGAVAVGVACLAVLPIQNYEVLGSWRQSPLALYTRQYMPFDVIGFGLDSTPPSIGLPANLQSAQLSFMARHREHRPGALPKILATRLHGAWLSAFGGWRVVWIPAAIVGVFVVGATGWFVMASGLVLYLAYLLYAHEPQWTIYYLEATPILAFVSAAGLVWLLQRATAARHRLPFATAGLAALAIVAVAVPDLTNARMFRASAQRPFRALEQAVLMSGRRPALVFLRYSEGHDPNVNLLRNVADPATAPIITAYDRGPVENERVIAGFAGRTVQYWRGTPGRLVPSDSVGGRK